MARLQDHYDRALSVYGEHSVLGVFHYGSFNYNCDTENSDVDTKCIIIPGLYNLAVKPYKIIHLEIEDKENNRNEICECMTIQHMVENWLKQNPNFLEIMYTKYAIINPIYFDKWNQFIIEQNYRERIAYYNVRTGILSIAHQAIHTIKQDPLDGKKIGNALRLLYLLKNYYKRKPYEICLKPTHNKVIRNFKRGTKKVSLSLSKKLIIRFQKYIDMNLEYDIDHELKPILDDFILNLVKFRLSFDIYEEK